MTNNNLELIKKISNDQILKNSNFSQILETKYQDLTSKKIQLAYQKYPERSSFTHFLSNFDRHNTLEKEDLKRKQLIKISNQEIFSLTKETFEESSQQLFNWVKRTVENTIENQEIELDTVKQEIVEKEVMINTRDRQLALLKEKFDKVQEELANTQNLLASIKSEVQTQLNSPASNQRAITSTENHLETQLKELENKYSSLEENNLSIEDKLALKRTELKEYIKLAEKLIANENAYQTQLVFLNEQVRLLKLEKTLLLISIGEEQIKTNSLTEELINFRKDRQAWEAEKAFAQAKLQEWKEFNQKNIEKFNKNALENAQLSDQVIDLEKTIKEGIKHVKNLDRTIVEKNLLIQSLRENLQRENRKKKVLTVSNWIRYGSSYFVNDRLYSKIDTSITSATSYYVVKDFDNWSYELIFMLLGVFTWKLTKRIWNWWKGKGNSKEVIEIETKPQEIEVVEMKEAKNLT